MVLFFADLPPQIALGLLAFFVSVIGFPILFLVYRYKTRQKEKVYKQDRFEAKTQYLLDKFGDYAIVQRVLERDIQFGDSKEFVLEAFGNPSSVDIDTMKTKTKETWKYKKGNENRKDQYNIQIKFENGYIVGWEDKNH